MGRKPYYRGPPDAEAHRTHLVSLGRRTSNGCLVWDYGTNPNGYGMARDPYLKKTVLISRMIMSRSLGRTLDFKEFVLHKCDNPPCYEVDHLEIGDQGKNMRDASNRGRCKPGKKILSYEDVLELHNVNDTGLLTQSMMGELFGVHQSTVNKILRGHDRKITEKRRITSGTHT